MITDGVQLPKELQVQLVQLAKLRQLHLDSDIHGERDFGEVAPDGENYFENRILRLHP